MAEMIELNAFQKKAITYTAGPLLIVAGAGTGKTTVITEKIKYLIQKKHIPPNAILALTFTEKAALEMEERTDQAMPYGYFQMWISTFHGFCDQILKTEGHHIGVSPGFRILTEAESVLFMREHLFLMKLHYFRPLGNPHKFISALLQHFSRLKDEDITPEAYIKWVKRLKTKTHEQKEEKEKYKELAEAYRIYQSLKHKKAYLDFSDLIVYTLQLFRTRPSLLKQYQRQFQAVLVDEFQDTNIAQYQLIKLLCPPTSQPKLTVVGDDSQAIYKFRGASVSNILAFMHDYKKAKQITLKINYRSVQPILDASYKLIQQNNPDTLESQLGISKQLDSTRKAKKDHGIQVYVTDQVEDEARFVSDTIISLKSKYKYSDFAILLRANSSSNIFTRELSQKGIPYQFLGPGVLFKQPEVKDLIAYLQVLNDPEDSVSLFRVLSMELIDIDQKDLTLLLSFAKKTNLSLFVAIERYLDKEPSSYTPYIPLLTKDTQEKLPKFITMLHRHLKLSRRETAGQVLYYFLEDTGYLSKLTTYKTAHDEKIALNISKFFSRLKRFETDHEDASVKAVVDFINMSMELGESPVASREDIPEYDAVTILTVHSAKGLEFPVVFMVHLNQGKFPTNERKEIIPIPNALIKETLPVGDYHIQEERRLFYVGLTRGKDYVFLSAPRWYTDGKRERRLSPFIEETVGHEKIEKLQYQREDVKKQLELFEYKKVKQPEAKIQRNQSTFSFSQLQSYETCPLQYKYNYILRVPSAQGAAASFGDTIHRTLQTFYKAYLKDRSLSKRELFTMYESVWIPLGYTSKAHEKRMKEEGKRILGSFYETFHTKNLNVKALEQPFKIRIDASTYITGKIDRVDSLPQNNIEIIDYKTGKKPKDTELKKSLQLSIYGLAATDKGLYKKKIDEVHLTFYYLQTGEKITMKRTDEEIASMKKQVITTIDEIRTSSFPPKVGPWCDYCPFRMICEAWQ